MSLNAFCFYIYTKSLFLVLSGKKIPFEVTPKSGSSEASILRYKKITPVLIVVGLLGFAAAGHTMKILSGDTTLSSGLINVIWSLFFMFLLSSILRFK
jgi:ribose/xylose/arabinose/galactoside ABC-type transport system permease subunit